MKLSIRKTIGFFALLTVGVYLFAPRRILTVLPTPRIPGMEEGKKITLNGQDIYYEVGGAGPPVVFIHGIGGGNSGYQWIKNVPEFLAGHRVYVLDLPGFGRSMARPQHYSAGLYVAAIEAFLKEVVHEPCTVVASSLAGAYAIKIAHDSPDLIKKLALVSPTGIDQLIDPPNMAFYHQLIGSPIGSLFSLLIRSRLSVSYFLNQQVYLDRDLINEGIKDVYHMHLQLPHAQYPIFAFITGHLNLNIKKEWENLTQPTVVVWGARDINTPVKGLQNFKDLKPELESQVLYARAIPNDEKSVEFNGFLKQFLGDPTGEDVLTPNHN
ncbi:alpha/beta fold hydrolase [Deinococcus roseus]|uniref:Alpha/beta hydrolase n=1 Tax=Deinococcus roseus TaxID=392414 RepID=A0ABQ2DA23_9DEIO|nr:alpha/beta hydrolase [Deinococcus roseus]GGJ51236.1 alpha/beta hydrolase [Deinococcus roseus]